MGKRKIKVTYDGEYPNACSGRLKIWINGKSIYNKQFCCLSSGSVWFDEEGNEHVEEGFLTWNEAKKFDKVIQNKVDEVLSKIHVCCGGCV